jgi:SPP1 gp7 family putative phage head morphogenesis protein
LTHTTNDLLRDALTRHQVDLLAMSNGMRNRVVRLLDATERDLREAVARGLARGVTPASAERLIRKVRAIRSQAFVGADGVWTSELAELAREEAKFLSEALSATAPVLLDLALPSARRLADIVRSRPLRGAVLSDWTSRLRAADVQRLEGQIRIGLVNGESSRQIARRLLGSSALRGADGATQVTRSQAEALSRTAVIDVSNAAKQDFYAANADIIDSEVWIATLDDRTCPVCGGRDGEEFRVGEGPVPPAHMGCRCVRVAAIAGGLIGDRPLKRSTERDLLDEFTRANGLDATRTRSALPRGFKGEFDRFSRRRVRELTGAAPAKTMYEAFLKRQSNAFQERVLGVEKARLFREGKVPLDRFRVGERALSLKEVRALDLEDLGGLDVAFPQVGQRVESLLARGLSNQGVADAVRREFPDVATTAKSVASVKSTLKKGGAEFPTSKVDLEPSRGASQAITDLEEGLPAGVNAPANWATEVVGQPGVYGTYVPGRGVELGDAALRSVTRQQARQVAAHELGHMLHKTVAPIPADDLQSIRANIARMSREDLKRYGYYLATEDELVAEVYSQALSPSPVTSQGLAAARFSEVFAEDIARARARLTGVAAPRAATTPPVVDAPTRLQPSVRRTQLMRDYMGDTSTFHSIEDFNEILRKDGLSPVSLDTQKILKSYTDNGYLRLNRDLRAGSVERPLARIGLNAAVSTMDDALKELPVFRGQVTRFVELEGQALEAALVRYSKGTIVEERAFTSATTGDGGHLTSLFGGRTPSVTMRIESRTARSIHRDFTSTGFDEREVVFPRGTRFEVTDVKRVAEEMWEITLREVGR